jgi:hypothetical protein
MPGRYPDLSAAFHESGHAIVGQGMGRQLDFVQIFPAAPGPRKGVCVFRSHWPVCVDDIYTLMAGSIAEHAISSGSIPASWTRCLAGSNRELGNHLLRSGWPVRAKALATFDTFADYLLTTYVLAGFATF